MNGKIESVLAQAVDDITAGRTTVEEVLRRYPNLRDELEPLLQIALGLRERSSQVVPPPGLRSRVRHHLMEAVSAPSPSRGLTLGNIWKRERRPGMVFKLATAMAALLVVLGLGGGTVYAAQDAQFGDLLYPVKTATEQARLVLSTSASGKAATHLDIAQNRLDELTNATIEGKAEIALTLATQYRSHVMEALAWAAQASDNRSAQATLRLQERLEAHLTAMTALGQEMPNASGGNSQGKGPGKPEGPSTPAAGGTCVYVKTGAQDRYQVWCNGVHVVVNTEDIEKWLEDSDLLEKAEAAADGQEAASPLLELLEGDDAVEHFNFYAPLSHLNAQRSDQSEEDESEDLEQSEVTGKTTGAGCVTLQTGKWNRYQVWCSGVHIIVRLQGTQTIEQWLDAKDLSDAANEAATDEAAADLLIAALDADPLVEHFNFYGPLSKIKINGPSASAEQEQEQEQIQAGGESHGRGPKSR